MPKTTKLAAIALSALMLVGCSRHAAGLGLDKDQVTAEYFDEAKKLELAPDWSWPTDPGYFSNDPEGASIRYGVNSGRVDAAWYWHCSWARTYFALPPGTDRDRAFAEVLKLRESAFYEWGLLPEDRAARDKVLDAAKLGDFRTLHLIIDGNCPVSSM
jgi:hypothetical protein